MSYELRVTSVSCPERNDDRFCTRTHGNRPVPVSIPAQPCHTISVDRKLVANTCQNLTLGNNVATLDSTRHLTKPGVVWCADITHRRRTREKIVLNQRFGPFEAKVRNDPTNEAKQRLLSNHVKRIQRSHAQFRRLALVNSQRYTVEALRDALRSLYCSKVDQAHKRLAEDLATATLDPTKAERPFCVDQSSKP